MNSRLHHIDMMRGIALFVMILIHTNAYFLSDRLAYTLWDISEFAVPVFIFCSAYLFFYKKPVFGSSGDILKYVKKRFARLLVPYYVFAAVFFGIIYLKEPQKLTSAYIFQSLTATGGIDINWLVFLFLSFAILMPVLKLWIDKRRLYFYLFCVASLISSVIFLFNSSLLTVNYRWTMWLPWSLVIVASYFVFRYEKRRWFYPISLICSFGVFVVLRIILSDFHRSLVMYNNKYPPNLYHLAYGLFSLIILLMVTNTGLFRWRPVFSFFGFLSKYSYPLFFSHYAIVFILMLFFKFRFTWISFFATVFLLSIATQFLINLLAARVKKRLLLLNVV